MRPKSKPSKLHFTEFSSTSSTSFEAQITYILQGLLVFLHVYEPTKFRGQIDSSPLSVIYTKPNSDKSETTPVIIGPTKCGFTGGL